MQLSPVGIVDAAAAAAARTEVHWDRTTRPMPAVKRCIVGGSNMYAFCYEDMLLDWLADLGFGFDP